MNSRNLFLVVLTVSVLRLSAQDIFTFAGNGVSGFGGDGGSASSGELNSPRSVALDQSGNLIIADNYNNRVRKVTPLGIISTIAGNGTASHSGDGHQADSASIYGPLGVALDKVGNIYVVEYYSHCIRKINTSGIISTFAGNTIGGFGGDGGPATAAQFYYPAGIAIDTSGAVYVSDGGNERIRKIDKTGMISTIAGNGTAGYAGDGGPSANSLISSPRGIAVDRAGTVYFSETTNQVIRIIRNDTIGTFAGVAMASGYSGDGGQALNATFDLPYGVSVDTSGNVYIADYSNDCIRKVAKTGIITTVAGNGNQGFSGDKGPATSARLNGPIDMAVANDNTIYIADFNNNRVRAVCYGACFLGMDDLSEGNTISVYPNPNNGSFNITLSDDHESTELLVTDAVGREVHRQPLAKGNNAIVLSSVSKGIYICRIFSAGRSVKTGKVAVE